MSLIQISEVQKTYIMGDTSFNAINSLNLTIEAGQFISIMGQSGSGKSTLMNILGCLDKPSKGNYFRYFWSKSIILNSGMANYDFVVICNSFF